MIEMKLRENAMSSLQEGLICWKQAQDGDQSRYKFAILHISHFFELALKAVVYDMHPLLVYKQPASKNLSDANTITPQEAFYIIKNSAENSLGGIEFDEDEIEPLIRLKKVRNAIEHFVYDLSPEEIKEDIILFLETVSSMASDRADMSFADDLDVVAMAIYDDLFESV